MHDDELTIPTPAMPAVRALALPAELPAALPAALHGRAFQVSDAVRAGVTRGQLRGPALAAPFYGVRVASAAPTSKKTVANASTPSHRLRNARDRVLEQASAYAATMTESHCFSHQTAAILLGLPVPARLETDPTVHVLTRAAGTRRRGAGVTGHHSHSTALEVCLYRGLQVVAPVSVWHQLAPQLSVDELIVLGDALVRRKRPYSTMLQLAASVDNLSGRRGSARLREAIALIRPRTDSARESECRLALVRAGLPEPVVNATILDEQGNFVAFGDIAYPEYKVLVEYDGGQHRADEAQYHRDIDRLDALMALGWRVLRFNKSHLRRSGVIVERTREALLQRGWRP